MTAKEALHERVERFTEAEAEEWLARIEWDSTETETLSDAELAQVLAAEAAIEAGEFVDGEELFRELGL